ncbi:MAG: TonB-dependent receptor plug domain-containing protein, partial [Bacteroidales bacterium]|nr:TonB-dependent receptor plug domain-containing protein [Bacteroidales bacterium]
MKKLAFFMLTLVFTSAQLVMAQSVNVSGKIISAEDGEALPGVSVVVQGTSSGTLTDTNGAYQISVPANGTLDFSFIGMQSQEVPVQGRTRIDIKMLTELHSLEEVMVVAYGTAKKASYTGSAEMVKTKQIEQRTVGSVTKAIEGVVAGVQTTSGGGQPGSDNSIRIRGYGSIYASSAPLYVVDGVPYDGQINSINPSDISSISILKDAAASSLYGSRAANGVVIITTKKGSAGLPVINFKGTWGVSSRAFPNYDRVNQAEYMELAFESRKNDMDGDGAAALDSYWSTFGGEMYNPFNMASDVLIDPNTGKVNPAAKLKWNDDWVDEALNDNPLRQDYQLSINGGTEKSQYLISLGYLNE